MYWFNLYEWTLKKKKYLKFLKIWAAFLSCRPHDVKEIRSEYKGDPFFTDAQETFVISQNVTKINVEEVSFTEKQKYYYAMKLLRNAIATF